MSLKQLFACEPLTVVSKLRFTFQQHVFAVTCAEPLILAFVNTTLVRPKFYRENINSYTMFQKH